MELQPLLIILTMSHKCVLCFNVKGSLILFRLVVHSCSVLQCSEFECFVIQLSVVGCGVVQRNVVWCIGVVCSSLL